jgi:hypothetical protein
MKEQFVGTWQLKSVEAQFADGEVGRPYGQNPHGYIIYDGSGHVAVQFMNPERPACAGRDKSLGTDGENRAAIRNYEAYLGTYEVDEANGEMHHYVEGSLFPNWTGSHQRRFFEFADDRLVLSPAEIPYNGTKLIGRLVWERVA